MEALKRTLLPLLTLAISSVLLHSCSADPLWTDCVNSVGNYTSSDPYAQSLTELGSSFLDRLKLQPVGFTIVTAGTGDSTAYGLALCRRDVSSSTCNECVTEATAQLRRSCPNQKEAITWYDNCMVRYAARNFFGVVEDGFRVFVWLVSDVSDPATFNQKVVNLLKRVSSEAYGNEGVLFGTEEADVVVDGKKEKLYSLAQCTRDIKANDCKRCLQDILGSFPNCCNGKRGGRVLSASCNFRYELFRFY